MWGFGGQAGYYTDAETGLILCTNRFYDPQPGRFLTRDPIGYAGGINLYGYTENNPANRLDPTNRLDPRGFAPQGGLGNGIPSGDGLGNNYLKTFFPAKPPPFFYNSSASGVLNKFGNDAFQWASGVGRTTAPIGITSGTVSVVGDVLYLASPNPGLFGNVIALGGALVQAPYLAGSLSVSRGGAPL